MDGGGALILRRFRFGLEERDRDAFLDQSERRHRPHGPGADHDHPITVLHHPLQTITLIRISLVLRCARSFELSIRLSKSLTSKGGTTPRRLPCDRSSPAGGPTASKP